MLQDSRGEMKSDGEVVVKKAKRKMGGGAKGEDAGLGGSTVRCLSCAK